MSEEDYPRVVWLLKERVPHWKLVPGANIDDIIERAIDTTMCGLLNEFESTLERLEDASVGFASTLVPKVENFRRCPFEPSRGCNQGKTAYIRNVKSEGRETIEQTHIICAAWVNGRCCLLPAHRVDDIDMNRYNHTSRGYGPTKSI
jgi:hypothetical protein